jgi:hypothetical protein
MSRFLSCDDNIDARISVHHDDVMIQNSLSTPSSHSGTIMELSAFTNNHALKDE